MARWIVPGEPHEVAGDGDPRWMVTEGRQTTSQNPAYRRTRSFPLSKRSPVPAFSLSGDRDSIRQWSLGPHSSTPFSARTSTESAMLREANT